MPLERNGLIKFLAFLVLAALSMPPAQSWADGGGAGIQFQIEYDDNAGSEVDEAPDSATTQPSGFGFTPSVKYDLSKWLEVNVSYFGVTELNEQESSPGITLDGPRFSDETVTYFSPRFNARFPRVSYTPREEDAALGVGDPVASFSSYELGSLRYHWSMLWANDTTIEDAAEDPSPRVGYSFSSEATDDLRLRASYTMREDDAVAWRRTNTQQVSTATDDLAVRLAAMTPEEMARVFFRVPEDKVDEFLEGMRSFIQAERVRNFLGDDTYRKLQEEYGSSTNGAGTQPFTSDSAADYSGWSAAHLYCGGSCVYGF